MLLMRRACWLAAALITLLPPALAGDDAAAAGADAVLLATATNWRLRLYSGELHGIDQCLAPAAPTFVDRRSLAGAQRNAQRIQAGSYGYQLLGAKTSGDAGVVALQVAWIDGTEPQVAIWPFYCWRHEGTWKFLPDPGRIHAWYQSVPSSLDADFTTVQDWFDSFRATSAVIPHQEAEALIVGWREAAAPALP